MKQSQKGFTLIELMIVIAIIGVLAAIAMPAYQDYVVKAQVSESLQLMKGMKTAVWDIYTDEGTVDNADNGYLNIPLANQLTGKYTTGVTVVDGVITATLGGDASSLVTGKKMILTPDTTNKGALGWICSSDADDKYVPNVCK